MLSDHFQVCTSVFVVHLIKSQTGTPTNPVCLRSLPLRYMYVMVVLLQLSRNLACSWALYLRCRGRKITVFDGIDCVKVSVKVSVKKLIQHMDWTTYWKILWLHSIGSVLLWYPGRPLPCFSLNTLHTHVCTFQSSSFNVWMSRVIYPNL